MRSVELARMVAERAKVDGDLVLVDEFINHRVDPAVMRAVGEEIGRLVEDLDVDLLLTAEASGIPPALAAGFATGLPVVYARKFLGPGDRYAFSRAVTSPTKGVEYLVEVARKLLPAGRRVAIVDDFLSGGRTAEALGEIAVEAGSEPVLFVFVLEKTFMEGRHRLEAHGWTVASLVRITGTEGGVVRVEGVR